MRCQPLAEPDPTTEAHAARIAAILGSTPAEHTVWLEEALKFSNTPSFRQQLRDLLQEADALVQPWLRPSRKALIQQVYEAWNSLTHLDKRGAPIERDLATLFQLCETPGFVLQAILLRRLGCSDAEIVAMLQDFNSPEAKRESRTGRAWPPTRNDAAPWPHL